MAGPQARRAPAHPQSVSAIVNPMIRRRTIAAVTALLLLGGAAWLSRRQQPPVLAPGNLMPGKAAPPNAAHEKAFLAEQLRVNPTHGPILLRLAQIERGEGNPSSARLHLEQAVAADGTQVELRLELGLVCGELGDSDCAEEQNRAVLRLDSAQPDALYNLGALAANRGDAKQARLFWQQAVSDAPKSEGAEKSRRALERLQSVAP